MKHPPLSEIHMPQAKQGSILETRAVFFVLNILLVFFFMIPVHAQLLHEKGVPALHNFAPGDYLNSGKIWDIASSSDGIIYMASDKGLLEFDGELWYRYKGSAGFTRSLKVVNDSLIYTGSDLDFGIWRRDAGGDLWYTSLYPFKDVAREENEEFWNVEAIQDDIVFISFQNLYVYKDDQLVKIGAPERISTSFIREGKLFLADVRGGIYELEDYDLKQVAKLSTSSAVDIFGSYQVDEDVIWVTRNQGLIREKDGASIPVNRSLSNLLQQAKVFCFTALGDEYLAFGTVLKGLIITDKKGRIIHQINRFKGLPGNTILAVHYSPFGKLWLSLEYGLSMVNLTNPLSSFFDYGGQYGSGYTAALWRDRFYLGTNQGLYTIPWEGLDNNRESFSFDLVPGTEGQVWELKVVGDGLFMGHDKGFFQITETGVRSLSAQEGVWTIQPLENFLLTGTYNGVGVYRYEDGVWEFQHKMDLVLGSSSQLLATSEDILWVNIPNYGVLRVTTNASMQAMERTIFPDSLFKGDDIVLKQQGDSLLLHTDAAHYLFDKQKAEFTLLDNYFPAPNPVDGPGVIRQAQPVNGRYLFIPRYNGFSLQLQNQEVGAPMNYPPLLIRSIEAFHNEDTIAVRSGDRVSFAYRNIQAKFIVPHEESVVYRYKRVEEDTWSPWSSQPRLEMLLLTHGSYSYVIQAGVNGQVISESSFAFSIMAPWYATWYAKLFYIMAFLAFVLLLRHRYLRSLAKQRTILLKKEEEALAQQAALHQKELAELEQQRLQEQYEDVKHQLKNKTVELAVKAREAEEKNKLIQSLRELFEKSKKSSSVGSIKWAEMDRILNAYLKGEDKTFEIQMDELHQEFFKKLKDQFPNLSSNDLRLCAYLKIGLNSKEIAELLNIQPSSSYISRSRLRKKLQLRAEDDLFDFLNSI